MEIEEEKFKAKCKETGNCMMQSGCTIMLIVAAAVFLFLLFGSM